MAESVQQQTNGAAGEKNASPSPLYRACLPHLVVEVPHASDAVSFYKRAFGAEEVSRSLHPKRKAGQDQVLLLHSHLKFGSAEIMLCDETEETGPHVKSPASLKGTSVILHILTDDADAAYAKALEAGAKPLEEVADQPWGMRYGKVMDPYGFAWSFGTPLKGVHAAGEQPGTDGQ